MSIYRFVPITLTLLVLSAAAQARDQIRIVGSSTVFPFATAVAERLGRSSKFRTPIVESTGSGGGLKLFCAGIGEGYPDVANASRRIKTSEVENCRRRGVGEVVEVKFGYDGIVLANSRRVGVFSLSLRDVFLALAKDIPSSGGKLTANPHRTWRDVNAKLPATRIEVLGPPPPSGTRDAFVEVAMEGGCQTFAWIKALKKSDRRRYKTLCHTLREDGAFIEVGENDNLIVQKLDANPRALGIFGFSFLDQNADRIQGSSINGQAPEFEAIADGSYPISRPLYFYVKKDHIGRVPGLAAYIAEFMHERASGDEGYLTDKGLIPLPAEEHKTWSANARALTSLTM